MCLWLILNILPLNILGVPQRIILYQKKQEEKDGGCGGKVYLVLKNRIMAEIGDTLTVNCEIIGIDGRIWFEKGDKVTIRGFWKEPAHYSNLYPSVWIPEKLKAVKLDEQRGLWLPRMFEELNNEPKT